MPNIKKIKQTMLEQGIPEQLIKQICLTASADNKPMENLLAFIDQMEKSLSREQCLSIMQEQGCHKTERVSAPFRAFGQTHVNASIAGKISLLSSLDTIYHYQCRLNSDSSLSVYWGYGEKGNYRCLCTAVNKLSEPLLIPLIYCGCCGGHVRYNLQYAFGVKLRLIDIVSSPISSNLENLCEFTFEIVE